MLYPRIRELGGTGNRHPGSRFCAGAGFFKVGSRHLGLVLPEEIAGLKRADEPPWKMSGGNDRLEFLAELGAEKKKGML